jgi:RNA polymerase sigma-70 factor (ECF subfamily)
LGLGIGPGWAHDEGMEAESVDLQVAPAQCGEFDVDRLGGVYESVQASLARYLAAVVGQAAEDVASQVWVEAVSGLARFRGDEAAFRRWVFAIARRRVVDHRRRWWQRSVVLRPSGAADLDRPAGGDGAAFGMDARLAVEQIRRLPAAHAEIAEDVAEITGRSPSAVRVMQHRALRRLAPQLDRDPARGGEV